MATTDPNVPNTPTTPRVANTKAPKAKAPKDPNAPKEPRVRRTFMLHHPDDMSALGRFVSTDWRYAAQKAVSRGHTNILLRATGSREVRQFTGEKVPLAEPKVITRQGREITYSSRPSVKFQRAFVYDGNVDDSKAVATNPKNNA